MRVAFLIDRWQPERGGAERALAKLAAFLAEEGHEVHAYGLRGPRPGFPAPGLFHPLRVLGLTRGAREQALGRRMVRAARGLPAAVTIGVRHLPEVDLYWAQNGTHRENLRAHRRSRRPEEVALPRLRGRHRAFLRLEERLLGGGGVRRVVAVSRLMLAELAAAYPQCRNRLVLLPNGVDLAAFRLAAREQEGAALRRELGIAPRQPLLSFPGRDPWRKGLPALLAALATLADRPWRLVVAGLRQDGRWRSLAARLGLGERVLFRAHVEPVALAAAPDLCVLPTWRDTCGFVILEALATGTPVLTTRQAGAAEAITRPEAGTVLPDPGDASALARALAVWLDRLAAGSPDRDLIRATVLDRDERAWLRAMAELCRDLAKPTAGRGEGG